MRTDSVTLQRQTHGNAGMQAYRDKTTTIEVIISREEWLRRGCPESMRVTYIRHD